MVYRRGLLVSAALCGVLLSTVSLVPSAVAEKGVFLRPASPWAVTKAGGGAGEGAAYCALARRFEKGTILTVARNAADETSFALDFQGRKFDTAQPMDVTLDPGAGAQRSFQITPASSKAFVVRMGKDDAFFAALEKTGYLRADLGDDSVSFNIADMDIGQKNLKGCVTALSDPAAPDSANTADAGHPIAQELSALRDDISKLREENQNLSDIISKNIGGVSPAADAAPAVSAIGKTTITETGTELDSARKAVADLTMQLSRVRVENSDLKKKISAASGAAVPAADPARDEQIAALRAENEKLSRSLKDGSGNGELVSMLEGRVQSLEQENQTLRSGQGAAAPASSPEDQARAEAMQKQIESLTAQLQERDAKLVEMASLSVEMEELKAQNGSLQEQLAASNAHGEATAALEKKLRSLKEENTALKSRLIVALEDADTLRQKVASRREDDAQHMDAEIARLESQAGDEDQLQDDDAGAAPSYIAGGGLEPEEEELAAAPEEEPPPSIEVTQLPPAQPEDHHDVAAPDQEMLQSASSTQNEAERMEAEMMRRVHQPPQIPQQNPAQQNNAALEQAKDSAENLASAPHEQIIWNDPKPQQGGAPDALAPQQTASAPVAAPAAPVLKPPAKAAPAPVLTGPLSVPDLIARAGIADKNSISVVADASGPDHTAYQWRDRHIFGSAEQRQAPAGQASYDIAVKAYIDKTKTRCPGDFAVSHDGTTQIGDIRTDSYEIACIGANVDSSASLLFMMKNGVFTAVAHEAPSQNMDEAMDVRDRLLQSISGG